MLCKNCRFHLLCHMGRLGAEAKEDGVSQGRGTTDLCPTCGRFVYMPAGRKDMTTYTFFCEKRPLSRAMKQQWLALRKEGRREADEASNAIRDSKMTMAQMKAAWAEFDRQQQTAHILSTLMVPDPGPGLPPVRSGDPDRCRLRIAECLVCCDRLGFLSGTGARWLDLDKMAEAKEEGRGRRGVFGLRDAGRGVGGDRRRK